MKKRIISLIVFITLFLCIPLNIKADYDAIISGDTVRIRNGAGTNNDSLYTVNSGTPISVVDKTLYAGTGCSDKWYKITYKDKTGYVCSKYVKFVDNSFSGINTVDWTARVNANNVAARKSASTSSSTVDTLSLGVNVKVLSTVEAKDSKCSIGKWYKIQYYNNKTAYICASYVTKKEDVTLNDEEYSKTLLASGFTESYIPFLTYLHSKHPGWTFIAKNTSSTFATAVNSEEGKNYMQTTNNNYRTSKTPAEGSSWYKVNQAVIAFYMDPRNWLTEERIFMFEKLDFANEFTEKYPSMIKSIFGSGKLSDDKYTIPIFNAGKKNKISPVHIASRIKQEVTANGSDSTNGVEFTWKGKKYSGYYNFFNIGAYETTVNGVKYSAITRGLAYAAKLVRKDGSLWNDIEVSITEGSEFLADGYVNKGQGTLYYQKFNVSPDAYFSKYTHQYMTNIQAPATEGNSTYNSYKSSKILDEPIIFEIPVYNYMPLYTSLPNSGDNNNDLASLEIEGFEISPNFDEDVLEYESYVPSNTNEINVKATAVSSKAEVSGIGKIKLNEGDTDITITVKSETQDEKKYTITIKVVKDETNNNLTSTNDNQTTTNNKTIDTILNDSIIYTNNGYITNIKYNTNASNIINKLTSAGASSVSIMDKNNKSVTGSNLIATSNILTIKYGQETKTYNFVIKGDTSGDGKINTLDLLQILKHINGDKKLTSSSLLAADTSGDGKVNTLDLLQVLKHINGDKKL